MVLAVAILCALLVDASPNWAVTSQSKTVQVMPQGCAVHPGRGSNFSPLVFTCFQHFGGINMSANRPVVSYFSPAPTATQAQADVLQMRETPTAVRKTFRASSLEPHLPMIAVYLAETNASQQTICNLLLAKRGLSIHKSSLCRFIQRHPALAGLRPKLPTTERGSTS